MPCFLPSTYFFSPYHYALFPGVQQHSQGQGSCDHGSPLVGLDDFKLFLFIRTVAFGLEK